MEDAITKRNIKFDLIRFSGVLIIMIAHSGPPDWLYQLRNFGTPLLILGSALTYSFIYKNRLIKKKEFLKKRLKRLIVPVWLFLSIFFFSFWIASLILQQDYPFSIMTMVNSYNLFSGIGFVWIFKVYIILALITPFGLKLCYSTMSNRRYFSTLLLVYLFYEIAMYLFFDKIPDNLKEVVSQFFLIIIPFSSLYFYGLRLHTLSQKTLIIVIVISLLLFAVLAIQKYLELGKFIPTQDYKYPPTLYYLSYAFFCINFIYLLVTKYIHLTNARINDLVIWLSTNSLWIYLWHIFAFYLWGFLLEGIIASESFGIFLIKTCFLLTFSIVMTTLQITQVNKWLLKSNVSSKKVLLMLK